jgi:hypothetical protein
MPNHRTFGQPLWPEPEPGSDTVRDVYDTLFGAPPRTGRPHAPAGDDQPLFRLAELLRRFDAIDEARRAREGCYPAAHDRAGHAPSGDAGGEAPPRLLVLTPERLSRLHDLVARAYADVRNGCSADRMIADEMLNDEFLRRCWELGAVATPYELNWHLLNARKGGRLSASGDTKRFRIPQNRLNEFTFATEFAIRHVQDTNGHHRGRGISLDRILCDPHLARQFDDVAKRIAPGYSALEYRWAAFTIRKARRPYHAAFSGHFEHLGTTRSLRVRTLPGGAGLYRFCGAGRELYVGETDNIRRQIEIHFDNNGTAVFPDWLDPRIGSRIDLFVAPMPGAPSATERSRAKTYCTDAYRPNYNWLGLVGAA